MTTDTRRIKSSPPWRARAAFVWSLLIVCSMTSAVTACPTCKNDLHHSGTDFGFAVSILFMMAAPFCILAGWTLVIYRLRKQMKQDAISATAEPANLECNQLPG